MNELMLEMVSCRSSEVSGMSPPRDWCKKSRSPIQQVPGIGSNGGNLADVRNNFCGFCLLLPRRAFTLVELLVVIAIIGVLVALLLPAVQAARESARRMQCSNNLKQIGLAVQNHHDAMRYIPPGSVSFGNGLATSEWENWALRLLPYVELAALYDLYDFGQTNNAAIQDVVAKTVLPVMNCPSDVNIGLLLPPATGPGGNWAGGEWAKGSYKANIGRSKAAGDQTTTFFNDVRLTLGSIDNPKEVPDYWRGPFHLVMNPPTANQTQKTQSRSASTGVNEISVTSFKSITDGLSNTLMVGEYHDEFSPGRSAFWAYTAYGYNEATIIPELGNLSLSPDYAKCVAAIGQVSPCQRAFGSLHAGGVINWLFCDGSVHAIPDTVDIYALAAMATIAGGEIETYSP